MVVAIAPKRKPDTLELWSKFGHVVRIKEGSLTHSTDVDWLELELAFRDATGTESYVDTRTGEVIAIVPGFSDESDLRSRIAEEPERFVVVEPVDTDFARGVMRGFIDSLAKSELKAELDEAQRAQFGGLKRCLDLIDDDAGALNRYHRFEQSRIWSHIEAFLEEHGIAPSSRPPSIELFEVG